MTKLNLQNATNITAENPARMRTGFDDLDVAYGVNHIYDSAGNEVMWQIGLPKGRVSLWAGDAGVGKSRASMSICKKMCSVGHRALYVLNEDDPSNAITWVSGLSELNRLSFLGSSDFNEHKMAMDEVSPDIVVIDSVTGLPGFSSQNVIRDVMTSYKRWAKDNNCHIILLAHLNKEGEVKGNNDITYYPDHVCELMKMNANDVPKELKTYFDSNIKNKGYFMLKFTNKNRGGLTGHILCFQHVDSGVILRTSYVIGYNT